MQYSGTSLKELYIYLFIALQQKCWRSVGLLVLQPVLTKTLQLDKVCLKSQYRKEKKLYWLDLGSLKFATIHFMVEHL